MPQSAINLPPVNDARPDGLVPYYPVCFGATGKMRGWLVWFPAGP
jgi:hypothetical protein